MVPEGKGSSVLVVAVREEGVGRKVGSGCEWGREDKWLAGLLLARAVEETRGERYEMFPPRCRRRTDLRRPDMAAQRRLGKIESECARKNKNRFRNDQEIDNKPTVTQP